MTTAHGAFFRSIPLGVGCGALRRGLGVGSMLLASTCGAPEHNVDLTAMALSRGPSGELTVTVETDTGPATAVFDTGSPITFWNRAGNGAAAAVAAKRNVRLLSPLPGGATPIRASFNDALVIETALGPLGDTHPANTPPVAVIGADLLAEFSVEIGFAAPEVTFWRYETATDGFLAAGGYAVLRVPRRGGGRLEIGGLKDWLGRRSPIDVPASRLILRACGAPGSFDRVDPLPTKCCYGDLRAAATGVDLDLALSTGVGPVVLGRTAWNRLAPSLASPAAFQSRPLFLASSATPVAANWTTIPRLALINREVDPLSDPGPCAELGRARRLEQIDFRQERGMSTCALACDRAQGEPLQAENSAAYLELQGELAVAVIDDATPFLQALRAEVRPQGPEVDGVIGAQALASARLEIDYLGGDLRAIFSCEPRTSEYPPEVTPPPPQCRAVGRCPRLPDRSQRHVCFGLPAHGLPVSCDNPVSSCAD